VAQKRRGWWIKDFVDAADFKPVAPRRQSQVQRVGVAVGR
jgi:hypothetical protein